MDSIERKRLVTIIAVILVSIVASGVWWYASQKSFDANTQAPAPNPTTPEQPPATPNEPEPDAATEPAPEEDPAQPEREFEATLYFIGNSSTPADPKYRLYPEKRVITTASNPLVEAAQAVITGESSDPDTVNPWPSEASIEAVVFTGTENNGGYEIVFSDEDIAKRPRGMTKKNARVLVEQLVRSVQIGTSDAPVRFLAAGASDATPPTPLPSILGVKLTDDGLTPGEDLSYLSLVYITSPTQGETVDTTFTVAGKAATFEATVLWQLRQGNQVVQDGFTTAQECCTLSPYRFDITAEPGDYTLVVKETDPSDGEGGPIYSDRREITVR